LNMVMSYGLKTRFSVRRIDQRWYIIETIMSQIGGKGYE
jgi:hypothetical protein